mmetsp:Transcript_29238/g.49070  ORF Transcript_29238/g.49070 Transcript_29238/m.49070 type:complete len:164 (-) Transcript_29238:1284-1775(-)
MSILLQYCYIFLLTAVLCNSYKRNYPCLNWKQSARHRLRPLPTSTGESSDLNQLDDLEKENTRVAMENARKSYQSGLSPGAGLATADEQAEAAYADLINTSMDQRGIENLTDEELELLSRGGKMWEEGSTSQKRKFGVFSDIMSVMKALSGGAHIEKNEFGET